MSAFTQDVQYALRVLVKAPGYACITILTLALGIGANTTIFSWINGSLLNPVPGIANQGEVVALSLSPDATNPFPFTYPDFEALRNGQQSFTGLTSVNVAPMSLTGTARPKRLWGMITSANYFDLLGVHPILGRTFSPDEDTSPGGAPVVVISYRLWQTQFGGRRDVVGQTMDLNEHRYTVIGVTPPVFQGSQTGVRADLYVPMMMQSMLMPQGDLIHDHHYFWLFILGRLKPGVTLQQAQEEMTLRLKPEVSAYPDEHRGHEQVTAYPLWRSPFGANLFFSTLLPMLMAISGFVLLLACANVANLMLVRNIARRREMAVRMSLGASRWRLVRQLLVESVVLALAGGAIAMLMTVWTSGSMARFVPQMDFPFYLSIEADRTVLAAAFVFSLVTGIVFGILPALRASSDAPGGVLKEVSQGIAGGSGQARLTSALAVAQLALSLLLLVCAGLFIRSFVNAQQIDPGFNSHNILMSSYDLYGAGYTEPRGIEFDRQLLARLETLPGVQSVMLSNRTPLTFGGGSTSVKPEGYVPPPNVSMETQVAIVSPKYFATLQLPLDKGRDFTDQDGKDGQRVIIVNQTFADRYWPGQEPLGKQVVSDLTNESFTVVGIARNAKYNQLNEAPLPFVYLPLYQVYRAGMTVNARVSGDPLRFAKSVEQAIHELDGDVVVFDVTSLDLRRQLSTIAVRIGGTFVGAFGLLALVLAAIGVYGVTSYTTNQRTHEIGIRLALGASRVDVLRLIVGRGILLTLVGLAIGLGLSFGATRFLQSLLLGVSTTDAMTFIGVALLLGGVVLVACVIPARRAMRVDPVRALRYE
ncbi:MAG TPA: ABC transporter permease [Gemmatimonadales bacterium]|nr:ABC transporter permease [Gemmatimonadales bacterium]